MLKTDILEEMEHQYLIEMTKIKNTERFLVFLVTVDIAKAFDSLDHNVLTSTTEEYGFA